MIMIAKTLLYHLLLCFILVESKEIGISSNFTFSSNSTSNKVFLFEQELLTVNLNFKYTINNKLYNNKTFIRTCWMDDVKVSTVKNATDTILDNSESTFIYSEIEIVIIAKRLGRSQLLCGLRIKEDKNISSTIYQDVIMTIIVKRISTIQESIFRYVIIFFVIFLNFVMGCGLDRKIIIMYLKSPISPAIGFCCQFIFMPLISFGVAKLTKIDTAFGFGLLTIGCSPGGGASNIWTILFGGDLNLSMTMTFISSCSALFMMPFWLFVFGRFFIKPTEVQIPYLSIAVNLLQIVIPVGIGMLFRWKFESKADILIKKVKIMGLLFIIFILTFGTYANLYIFKLIGDYPYLIIIGASLPWLGFVFGYLMALVTRRNKPQSIAISIETAFQNIGISILILKYSMPQPEGDLGSVMPIIVALCTPLPLYIILIVLTLKRKCCDKPKEEAQENNSIIQEQNEILLTKT